MAAVLDEHCRCLTLFSLSPVEEMGFYHWEMKFYVTFLCFDIHTKTTKLLHKRLLDQKILPFFKMAAILDQHVRFLDLIRFLTRPRNGILNPEMKFRGKVDCLDIGTKISKVVRTTTLELRCWTSFQDSGHIRLTWSMLHIILFSIRWSDGILTSRDEDLGDTFIFWYWQKNYQDTTWKVIRPEKLPFLSRWRSY